MRRAIQVSYNETGQQAGLVSAFFSKSTPTLLTRLSSGMSAAQEAKFFSQLRRELQIEAPVHRYSTYDRETGRSFHLWEDLTVTRRARFLGYRDTMTVAQAEQALQILAQLHGRYFESARFGDDLAWIPPYEAFHRAGDRSGTRAGHDVAMGVAEHLIPPEVIRRKDEIWPKAEAMLDLHSTEPRAVIHSDVHLGNWYVTGDGAVGLCDWQCISRGHWSRDLAYSLSTVLEVDERRAAERQLIGGYLERLHEFGGPKVDFDAAWLRYRQQLFAALLMWTPTLRHPATMPDMQPEEMSMKMIHRITSAMADLDAFDAVRD